MKRFSIVTTIIFILQAAATLPVFAGYLSLFDMDRFETYDVTAFFASVTGLADVRCAASVDIDGAEGDEWLVLAGEGRIAVVDTLSLTLLFDLTESDFRTLFSLGSGTGLLSSLTSPNGPPDCLLYTDDSTGSRYALDFTDFSMGSFTGSTLPEGFVTGFSFTEPSDIGWLVKTPENIWRYVDIATGRSVDLDLEALFGSIPDSATELEIAAGGRIYRYLLAVLPSAPPTPTPAPPTPTPAQPTPTPSAGPGAFDAVIANGLGETIWVVDGADYHVRPDVAYTGQSPNQIVVGDGEFYIVNSLSNSISVYDSRSFRALPDREIALGAGRNPFMMALAPDGTAYVTNFQANTVSHVDIAGGGVIGEISLPDSSELPHDAGVVTWARPEGICITGGTCYVACTNLDDTFTAGGPGIVCEIDTASGQLTGWFESGGRDTVAVAWTPAYPDRLWIASAGDYDGGFVGNGTISVWSISGRTLLNVVGTGGAPFEMAFGAERLYVADGDTGTVARLNLNTLELLPPLDMPGAGGVDFISGLAVDPAGILWVLTFNSDRLYLVDTFHDDTFVRDPIAMGDGPDAVAIIVREDRS